MKRKSVYFCGICALSILLLAYGCSDDSLSERDIQKMLDGQWHIVKAEIKGRDWELIEDKEEGDLRERYYRASVNLPELTENVFDEGAVIGYYKFDNDSKTALPYVKTRVDNNGFAYTETYSCDFILGNPSRAIFYLEASDAGKYDNLPPDASFQIILIY